MNRGDPIWFEAHHHGPGTLAWVFLGLFLVALAALAVLAWRALVASGTAASPVTPPAAPGVAATGFGPAPSAGVEEALQTARMRYARGELGREEFLQVCEDLAGPPPPAAPPPATAPPPPAAA